jgi:hypothetical protein
MNTPACAMSVLTVFRPVLSTPTYHRLLVLVLAAILATGRRTITNLQRTVQDQAQGHVSSYHRVLSQRRWSTWALARARITYLLDQVVPPGPVLLAGDDTVTEHPGPKVFGKGRHRDGVRSTHRDTAYRWGHKWVVISMLVKWPFPTRPWALPILVALVPSPGVGSRAWYAPSDASAPRAAAAGAPDALVSESTLHLHRRHGLRHQRDGTVLPPTSPSPHRGQHVLWRCRLVRASATTHAPDDRTPTREGPETGLPPRGRGEHGQAIQPHSGVVWRNHQRHRDRHRHRAPVPHRGGARGSPLGIRP